MKLKTLPAVAYNPGDRVEVDTEEPLRDIQFNVHKFTNRPKPDKSKVVIMSAFSEFGCESLIPLYCIPSLLRKKYRGHYSIVIGWYGREYLYRHLVDEFWELKEEFQPLRDYCRAFHHSSRNLKSVEKKSAEFGKVITAQEIGQVASCARVMTCIVKRGNAYCGGRVTQFKDFQQCQKCGFSYPAAGVFTDCERGRKTARWLPPPSAEKMEYAKKILPPNAVGVTARGRKCYGRNLSPEFYERLIWLLEDMGYSPVWLGEKITTLACPCPRIPDLSRDPIAGDFEQTLAIVSQMSFTIQFWTASTRLAGLVGTPFILFESPDQIWGHGQEGLRLHLTTRGSKKLVAADYLTVNENNTQSLRVVENAIRDIEDDDFSTIMGPVADKQGVRELIRSRRHEINWF